MKIILRVKYCGGSSGGWSQSWSLSRLFEFLICSGSWSESGPLSRSGPKLWSNSWSRSWSGSRFNSDYYENHFKK